MKDAILTELADTWEMWAETDKEPAHVKRRETLRECADALRMLVTMNTMPGHTLTGVNDAVPVTTQDCPHAAPFRYCPKCVADPCPIGLVAK